MKRTVTIRRLGVAALGAIAFADPAAAAPVLLQEQGANGVCTLPRADTIVGTGVLILRGALFIVAGVKAATAGDGGGDGDYGSSSKRMTIAFYVGLMAVAALFPSLMEWLLTLFGTSAGDMGIGCAW